MARISLIDTTFISAINFFVMKPHVFTKNDGRHIAAGKSSASAGDVWLDKQDILLLLHISSRTLQRWRKDKLLPFSQVGRKIFYRRSDLEQLLRGNIAKVILFILYFSPI